MTSLSLWQACVAEYVGVFFLCFYTIGFGLADKKPGPELLQVGGVQVSGWSLKLQISDISGNIRPEL